MSLPQKLLKHFQENVILGEIQGGMPEFFLTFLRESSGGGFLDKRYSQRNLWFNLRRNDAKVLKAVNKITLCDIWKKIIRWKGASEGNLRHIVEKSGKKRLRISK